MESQKVKERKVVRLSKSPKRVDDLVRDWVKFTQGTKFDKVIIIGLTADREMFRGWTGFSGSFGNWIFNQTLDNAKDLE